MHLRLILLCIQLCWIIIIIIIIIIINSKIIIVIIIIIIIATLIIVKYFFLTRRRRYRCWNGCRHWKQWKRMNPKVCAAHIRFKVKKYNEKTYVSPTHPVVPQVSISKFSPLQKLSGVVGGGLEQSRVRIRKLTPQLWLQELQLLQSDHALTPNKDCGEKSMQTYLSRPWFFPCKKIQDSVGFWTPRRAFRIPGTGFQSLSVKLRFWIPIVSGIPDSKFQDFGFH